MKKKKINSKKLQNLNNLYYMNGRLPGDERKCVFRNNYENLALIMPNWANTAKLYDGVWYWVNTKVCKI